jgi:hypothetical protein
MTSYASKNKALHGTTLNEVDFDPTSFLPLYSPSYLTCPGCNEISLSHQASMTKSARSFERRSVQASTSHQTRCINRNDFACLRKTANPSISYIVLSPLTQSQSNMQVYPLFLSTSQNSLVVEHVEHSLTSMSATMNDSSLSTLVTSPHSKPLLARCASRLYLWAG